MVKWTSDLIFLSKIRDLREKEEDWGEIFRKLTPRASNLVKNPDNLRRRYNENIFKIEDDNFLIGTSVEVSFDEAIKKLRESIKQTETIKPKKAKKKSKERTILIISDLHIPFHNEENLKKVINDNLNADTLVINGDFLDCYSVSKFSKTQNIPLKDEITQGKAIVSWLSEIYPEVIINSGNHDDRPRKYFESRIEADLMFMVKHDLLSLIAADLDNVTVSRDKYEFPNNMGETEVSHFTKIGDCLIAHFEDSSRVPFKVVHDRVQWIHQWQSLFGWGEIKLFLQGHTHQLGKAPINNNQLTIGETGCLCKVQGYTLKPSAKYRPSSNGYWVVYQTDGVTDINKSNYFVA